MATQRHTNLDRRPPHRRMTPQPERLSHGAGSLLTQAGNRPLPIPPPHVGTGLAVSACSDATRPTSRLEADHLPERRSCTPRLLRICNNASPHQETRNPKRTSPRCPYRTTPDFLEWRPQHPSHRLARHRHLQLARRPIPRGMNTHPAQQTQHRHRQQTQCRLPHTNEDPTPPGSNSYRPATVVAGSYWPTRW